MSHGSRRIAAVKPVQPSCIPCSNTGHIPPFSTSKAFVFHVRTSLLHHQSWFPRCVHQWLTYHVFGKLKVIIMGNSYGVLGYGVLDNFFWSPVSTLNANSHIQVDEPPQYSPKRKRAGRDTGTRSSRFFLHQLT